jgi:hypothetical protein
MADNKPLVHKAPGTDPLAPHVPGPTQEHGKPLVHGAPVHDAEAHAKAVEAQEDATLQAAKNAAKREDAAKDAPKEESKTTA